MFIFTVVTSAPQFFGTTVQVSWQNLKILWGPAHKIQSQLQKYGQPENFLQSLNVCILHKEVRLREFKQYRDFFKAAFDCSYFSQHIYALPSLKINTPEKLVGLHSSKQQLHSNKYYHICPLIKAVFYEFSVASCN